jgi:hypothetical protein
MTAIVGVLNAQGIAIAADSAVTISSGTNVKKVYNKGNKIFTLSKYQPVGIAVFNGANFMGIPWESLIKIYRENLKDKSKDTVEDYRIDFIDFLKNNLHYVTPEFKISTFYNFFSVPYNELKDRVNQELDKEKANISVLDAIETESYVTNIINVSIENYKRYVDGFKKNTEFKITLAELKSTYPAEPREIIHQLETEIKTKYSTFKFSSKNIEDIYEIFLSVAHLENLYENHSGLVFFGFGNKEIYPSSHTVLIGNAICNSIRYVVTEKHSISPGTIDANIIPYAQVNVTLTILTGIEPAYGEEIHKSINSSFSSLNDEVKKYIADKTQANNIEQIITKVSQELIQKLNDYKNNIITKPLLDMLVSMGKEDMAELAESLVNITSLKIKFTASDDSVGGPVDVAIITKGDGFIWMKRKHYFDVELNKGFLNKYFK